MVILQLPKIKVNPFSAHKKELASLYDYSNFLLHENPHPFKHKWMGIIVQLF